jgi:type II secretory pathway pseudopilin PulG
MFFVVCEGTIMDFIKMMSDNLGTTFILMLFIIIIVSIVLGILLEAYKVSLNHRQKTQELRNEELRLQLKLDEQKKEHPAGSSGSWEQDPPMPKEEPSWPEQSQSSYRMGYEQRG